MRADLLKDSGRCYAKETETIDGIVNTSLAGEWVKGEAECVHPRPMVTPVKRDGFDVRACAWKISFEMGVGYDFVCKSAFFKRFGQMIE